MNTIKHFVLRLRNSEFVRNVFTLMTGTVLAQLVPIAAAPLLTRLYAPNGFGLFAMYSSISLICAAIMAGKYELAIILPKSDQDSIALVQLCFLILSVVSLIMFVVLWFFQIEFGELLKNPEISPWLPWAAPALFLTGTYTIFSYWLNRKKRYRRLASARVAQSVAIASVNIGMGFSGFGVGGLIAGAFSGQITQALVMGIPFIRTIRGIPRSKDRILAMARKYVDFPKFSIPADLFGVVARELPVFLLATFFGAAEVGLYALTQRVLGAPIRLISNSFLDVFKERASNDFAKHGDCRAIFKKAFLSLVGILIIPFGLLMVAAPPVFSFIFGETWRSAGEFAQILSVMFFFKLIASPLSFTFYIAGKQKQDMVLHVFILVASFLSLSGGAYIFHSAKMSLVLFSGSFTLIYIIYIVLGFHHAKGIQAK